MPKRHSPLHKPWYVKAQYCLDDYHHAGKGWFDFTQMPNYSLMSQLFGVHGERVAAVRAEIELFDKRFFLSRWLRRPFSDVEYKRSRLYCYELVNELKTLLPLGVAEATAKREVDALVGRRVEQSRDGVRAGELVVTEVQIAAKRRLHHEASTALVQALETVIPAVKARYSRVSWFSGMHRTLKKLSHLFSKEQTRQKARVESFVGAAASAPSGAPVNAPAPTVKPTAAPNAPAGAAAKGKGSPVQSGTSTFWGAPPTSATDKPTLAPASTAPAKALAPTLLPELAALQRVGKQRARATTPAELQGHYDSDIAQLTAAFDHVNRGMGQGGASWLKVQLDGISKVIKHLLLVSYHPDKYPGNEACGELSTGLMKALKQFVEGQIKALKERSLGCGGGGREEALFRAFCESQEEINRLYEGMLKKMDDHIQRLDEHVDYMNGHLARQDDYIQHADDYSQHADDYIQHADDYIQRADRALTQINAGQEAVRQSQLDSAAQLQALEAEYARTDRGTNQMFSILQLLQSKLDETPALAATPVAVFEGGIPTTDPSSPTSPTPTRR